MSIDLNIWKNLSLPWKNILVVNTLIGGMDIFANEDENPFEFYNSIAFTEYKYPENINNCLNYNNYYDIEHDIVKELIQYDIRSINSLKQLNLNNIGLTDLSPITYLVDLDGISFAYNEINSLLPLSQLIKLKYINLSNNPIDNIETIIDLPKIETLKCNDTNITISQLNLFKVKHRDCEIII